MHSLGGRKPSPLERIVIRLCWRRELYHRLLSDDEVNDSDIYEYLDLYQAMNESRGV